MTLEFGSDFHTINTCFMEEGHSLMSLFPGATLFADGRQALISLVQQQGWNRLWVPEYFCYEILASLEKRTEVELIYYRDYPLCNNLLSPSNFLFKNGDAILRMNYFGLKKCDPISCWPVPVIEDHSHGLLSPWAMDSNADWCVASLRKSIPIAGGGMAWSPKGNKLKVTPGAIDTNEELMARRWRAMDLKANYLLKGEGNKEEFRKMFIETENTLDSLELSAIDSRSRKILDGIDIKQWYGARKKNWEVLTRHLTKDIEYLSAEEDSCTPFSLVIICETHEKRDKMKDLLIEDSVYPAILWRLPDNCNPEVLEISGRLLSIHCDGRYTENEIMALAQKINNAFSKI